MAQQGVRRVNMVDPFCSNLRKQLLEIAKQNNVRFKEEAVYIWTKGPRFETEAEIKMMK